jgi:membrane protein YdbS with pleckstrin-like domain
MNEHDSENAIVLRPSLISIFLKIVLIEITVAILVFGYYFLTSQLGDILSGIIRIMDFLVQTFLVVQLIIVSIPILQWYFTYQKLDKSGLVVKRGIFRKETASYTNPKIQSVNVDQGALGRMFNYGTINIQLQEPQHEVSLVNVSNPERIVQFLTPEAGLPLVSPSTT